MTDQFDHPIQPGITVYPQISAAAREIVGEVTRRISQRAAAITEIWKSSVACAICGEDHEPLPPDLWPHLGNPMDESSRKKMLLEEIVQVLSRMI